jgi:hypothetical protein
MDKGGQAINAPPDYATLAQLSQWKSRETRRKFMIPEPLLEGWCD